MSGFFEILSEQGISDTNAQKIIRYSRRTMKKIKHMIAHEEDKDKKLLLIEHFLHFCKDYITGYYSDDWIERQISKYGEDISFSEGETYVKDTALMVMTKASVTGGHTVLVNNWITFDERRKYSIVFTDCKKCDVPLFLRNSVTESGGKLFYLSKGRDVEKAGGLLDIAQNFEKIILHIHMYDMVPVMAFSNKGWTRPIYYCNHANFLFSVGMSISDMVLNIKKYDQERSLAYRGASRSELLPFPQKVIQEDQDDEVPEDVRGYLGKKYGFNQDSKIIISVGADYKYTKTEKYDFIGFVKRLMKVLPENTFFYIIGADPEAHRWRRMKADTDGRAMAIGYQPRKEISRWMKIADAYVVSFPMNAAGANEAKKNGVPCFRIDPIGRTGDDLKMERYESIPKMIKAINRCIRGRESFVTAEGEVSNNPDLWRARLEELFEIELHHKINRFKSKPVVGEEEIINVQLLSRDFEVLEFLMDDDSSISVRVRMIVMRLKIRFLVLLYKVFG